MGHDDPQELRVHALHHRPRHGGLQVLHRRRGLLRRLRRAGLRARERPQDGHEGRAVPQPRVHEEKGYVTAEEAKEQELSAMNLSGTKFRKMLRGGEEIPEWFAFKSVVKVLRENA